MPTAPRLKSVETSSAEGEGGAFTEILLKGLNGDGAAKIFVKTNFDFPYQVLFSQLAAYVEAKVLDKKFIVSEKGQPELYQRPYYDTKQGTIQHTGVLRKFVKDDPRITPVSLEINVNPKDAWEEATVIVISDDGEIFTIHPVDKTPVSVNQQTMPMSYTIRISAGDDYSSMQPYWSCNLYQDTEIGVVLKPQDTSQSNAPLQETMTKSLTESLTHEMSQENINFSVNDINGSSSESPSAGVEYGEEDTNGTQSRSPHDQRLATLTIFSDDPLAPLEITDNECQLIASGGGRLTVTGLKPGYYRARLVTPEGLVSEKLVHFSETNPEIDKYLPPVKLDQDIMVSAPPTAQTPIFEEVTNTKKTDFTINPSDDTLHFAEYVGAVATPQLTTMLAIIGSIVEEKFDVSEKIKKFGLPSFQEAAPGALSGIRIIRAADAESFNCDVSYLEKITLSLRRQSVAAESGQSPESHFKPSTEIEGVAQFIQAAEPGAYVLLLKLPDLEVTLNFSLVVLPERITLLVPHRPASRGVQILSFSTSVYPEPDFETLQRKILNLRRSELLQRYYLQDRLSNDHAQSEAEYLLKTEEIQRVWYDPFAGCLGGYMMLKIGKPEALEIPAANLIKHYGILSDSHILQAEFLKTKPGVEKEAITDAYNAALDRGIPVFAAGLQKVIQAIDDYEIEHPLVSRLQEIYENRIPNTIWTIWTTK